MLTEHTHPSVLHQVLSQKASYKLLYSSVFVCMLWSWKVVLVDGCENYLRGATLAGNPQRTFQFCYYCTHGKAKSSQVEPLWESPWSQVHKFTKPLHKWLFSFHLCTGLDAQGLSRALCRQQVSQYAWKLGMVVVVGKGQCQGWPGHPLYASH